MELRQFKYVNMVAQCGSVTKAARKLFISQPALSSYINKLEEELGVKLFDQMCIRDRCPSGHSPPGRRRSWG